MIPIIVLYDFVRDSADKTIYCLDKPFEWEENICATDGHMDL